GAMVRIIEAGVLTVDGRPGDIRLVEQLDPVGAAAAREGAGHEIVDMGNGGGARADAAKTRIAVPQLAGADPAHEGLPVPVVVEQHAQVAVGGAVRPPPRVEVALVAGRADRRLEGSAL